MSDNVLDAPSIQQIVYDTLDRSDDIVLIVEQIDETAAGIIVASANGAFCRAASTCQSDVVGRPLLGLTAPAADPVSVANLVKAVHERRSFRSELLCNRTGSAPFWFGLHLMPVRDANPPRFVVLGRDITDSLQSRQQQAAVQGLLAKVFLCVQVPVAILTENGVIQMTNPALDQTLGYKAGGLAGKRMIDCTGPSARTSAIAARQRQVENNLDYTVATSLLRADGTEVAVDMTSISVQQNDLRRFKIITLVKRADDAPPITVHIAGKIRLVGLQEVKASLGSRWAAAAERVMASAEHVIKRHCGPRDTYSRTQDGEFLICFGEATEDEAAFRAATISREIRKRLIGEGETGPAAQVSAMTAAVEVQNQPGRSADMLGATISERLNGRLAEIEEQARVTLRGAAVAATCELEAVRGRRSEQPVAQYAQLPHELEWRIQAAYCALPSAERKTFDFDRLVLGVVAEQIVVDLAAGRSTPILVNVDFEVFLDRRCTERYLAACQALDPRIRERLMLVLTDMPPGCPQNRVLECVTRLRPFCCSVGFQSETLETPTVDPASFGSPIVVLKVADLSVRNGKDMTKLGKLIEYFHNHRSRVLIRHVKNRDDANMMLRECGLDLVSVLAG